MTKFFKVSLGKQGAHAAEAREQGWVGVGWFADLDLTGQFPKEWRDFNKKYIPKFLETGEGTSRVAAGLACGMTWTVCNFIQEGDYVLSPKGDREYQIGRVTGPYQYVPAGPLPHRRPVEWLDIVINRDDLSEDVRRSTKSAGTVVVLGESPELEKLVKHGDAPSVIVNEENVESPYAFVLEKYLEDFLVSNWAHTELGAEYDIYSENDELVGQQYQSDTGPIDILAVSKDKKTLLVVELKRGKVSDVVVGQIQRYMGFVKEELLEPGQQVRGVIIGLDDDKRIQRALSVTSNIDFYKYEINFKLHKVRSRF
jgi:restriction system protein